MTQTICIDRGSKKRTTEIVVFLLQNGFFPADSYGRALIIVKQENYLGILWSPPKKGSDLSLWNIFRRDPSPAMIAQLSFADAYGDDTKEWNMCIFGQAYLQLGLKLKKDLEGEFEVDIRSTSQQCREPEKNRLLTMLRGYVQGIKLKVIKST